MNDTSETRPDTEVQTDTPAEQPREGPELILHIGAAKTGSSAIQRFLALNIDWFKAQGIVIPDRRLALSSRLHSGEHVFTLEELFRRKETDRLTATLDSLCGQVEPGQRLLLSAENMSNHGRHEFFREIAQKRHTEAILYIRRQDELLTSAWQQWHAKVEEDFSAWLIMALRQYGQWEQLIKSWENALGKGHVKIRVFEPGSFQGGDLLKDFLDCLGIDPETADADFHIGTVNPSYSDIITPLVAGNPNVFKDANDSAFYHMVGQLTGNAYSTGPKYSLITQRQREKIVEYYRQINQRICQEYFPGRSRLFQEVDHTKYVYLDESRRTELQLRFLTELIYKGLNKEQGDG